MCLFCGNVGINFVREELFIKILFVAAIHNKLTTQSVKYLSTFE